MTPQTINIKCPGCGVILTVTNSKNEDEKRFACPKCGKRIVVPFYKLNRKQEDGDTLLDGKEGAQATQMSDADTLQSCFITCNGKEYELLVGRNTIGRMATTSDADVQIDVEDRYMSREHAVMNVRRLPNGGLKVDITNHKNKNNTSVNGNLLQPGDAIVLHDGDVIRMGDTSLTFYTK